MAKAEWARLSCDRNDRTTLGRGQASVRLGGVVIYGPSAQVLRTGLDQLAETVVAVLATFPTVDRRMLQTQARVRLDASDIERRLLGAVLGWQARLGRIDCIPCAAINDKVFRIYVSEEQAGTFESRLDAVTEMLKKKAVLSVAEVRDSFWGTGWGMWSAASHLLARLAQKGQACYVDRFSFRRPNGLDNAVR